MKTFSRLFVALLSLAIVTSCGKKETFESKFFSVEIPDGLTVENIEEVDNMAYADGVSASDDKGAVAVVLFPFKADAKGQLQNQTIGGGNVALKGMSFGEIEPAKMGEHDGWKVPMTGMLEGKMCTGEVYAAVFDNACVIAFSAGENELPANTPEFLNSIKINKEAIDAFQSDPANVVDAVASLAKMNCPARVDEITTWKTVVVDNEAKSVKLIMEIDGVASEFGDMQALLDSMRPTLLASLRAGASSDMLISVPVSYGYSEGYDYVDKSGNVLATIMFSADELK